jgi:hypothetical protein
LYFQNVSICSKRCEQNACNMKVRPITGHEGPEVEWRYSSTLSLTSALDGGGRSTPHPGHFTRGKARYPLYRRLGGPQGLSGQVRISRLHRDSIPGQSMHEMYCRYYVRQYRLIFLLLCCCTWSPYKHTMVWNEIMLSYAGIEQCC